MTELSVLSAQTFSLRYMGARAAQFYLEHVFMQRAKAQAAAGEIWFPVYTYPVEHDEVTPAYQNFMTALADLLKKHGWTVDQQVTTDRDADQVCEHGWGRAVVNPGAKPWRLLQASPIFTDWTQPA